MPGDEVAADEATGHPVLRRRVLREAAAVATVMVLVAVSAVALDLFGAAVRWDRRHPAAHLGDVLVFAALSHLVMVVFGARRGRDLRRADQERSARTRELAFLAHHDSLTHLYNRAGFAAWAESALLTAQRDGRPLAVLVLDLDRFKEVNDSLGHHVGDQLLVQVAERLRRGLGPRDGIGRLGGDEFTVLLGALSGPGEAVEVARRLHARFDRPVLVGEMALDVGLSIGVACVPRDGDRLPELLRRADTAMYRAKAHHSGVEAYDPAHDSPAPERLALHAELRRGIERGELVVHYQPQVDLRRGTVRSVEALVRWQHPARGMVPPSDFLALAEQTGLIRALTGVVLTQSLDDVVRWRAAGVSLTVAVNLSVHSLRDATLPDVVGDLLRARGLPPSVLEVEITESMEIGGCVDPALDRADVLRRLRSVGVRVAVDDYGTGYSGLSYLSRLPLDVLKIDQAFVRTMDTDLAARLIVRSTVELAQSLGLSVVAEGVETEESWRLLADLGCDLAQGYWFARPGPADGVLQVVGDIADRLAARAA